MLDWIINTVNSLGYFGIGFLMFMENLFPPIPSELIMPLAGFVAGQGKFDLGIAIAAGVIGTIIGALPWYYAGEILGETKLRKWFDRYGKWFGLSGKDIDRSNGWFKKHGYKAVFLGRLVPGVRTVISLPAGISRMPMIPFLLYSTIGSTIWIGGLTWVGYLLGDNYSLVEEYLKPVSKIVVVILAIAFGVFVWKRKKQSRRRH